MLLNGKPTDHLGAGDIQALKDNRVAEGKLIDYKLNLHGGSDEQKRELCADVSSFANTAGGHIVFGVEEAGGIPASIPGLTGIDRDKEQLRLDQTQRSGLDPRLPSLAFKWIEMPGAGVVLVVAIPMSNRAPHSLVQTGRFWERGDGGKFALNTDQIRESMTHTTSSRRWLDLVNCLVRIEPLEGHGTATVDNLFTVLRVTADSVVLNKSSNMQQVTLPMHDLGPPWGQGELREPRARLVNGLLRFNPNRECWEYHSSGGTRRP